MASFRNVPGVQLPQYPAEAPPQLNRTPPLVHALLLQAVHCASSTEAEKEPAGQAAQRAAVWTFGSATYLPAKHGSCTAGTSAPASQ